MKTYGRIEMQLHAFLTSALDLGERLASRSSSFTPWESAPFTHSILSWLDHRSDLEAVTKIKNPFPCWEIVHQLSRVIFLLYLYSEHM